jgi:hypothetical protein
MGRLVHPRHHEKNHFFVMNFPGVRVISDKKGAWKRLGRAKEDFCADNLVESFTIDGKRK